MKQSINSGRGISDRFPYALEKVIPILQTEDENEY
jgi:hypothetical protein